MSIGITVTPRATDTVVAVSGEIDLQTAPDLDKALSDLDVDVVVDLTACDFLDSTALGVLVGTANRLRSSGHSMSVVCSNPRLLRVFRITRLDKLWPMHEQVPGAPAS